MAKSMQYMVTLMCLALLISYQNCAPALSPVDGNIGLGSGNTTGSLGNFYLDVVGPIAVGPGATSIRIYGYCSPGRSRQNHVEWQLYTTSNYSGTKEGQSGSCMNQYYDISIPLSSGFNYQAGNRVNLKYVVYDEEGNQDQKIYSVDLAEGVAPTSDVVRNCGNFTLNSASALRECDLSNYLARTTLGYGGVAIKARVTVGSQIQSRSDFYGLFSISDFSHSPYFTYGTGRSDNPTLYTLERFLYGNSKFTVSNNVWMGSQGRFYIYDSSKPDQAYAWVSGRSYDIDFQFSVAPAGQGTSVMIMKVCPAGSTTDCFTESSLRGGNGRVSAYIKKAFGMDGLKIVLGDPDALNIDGWINPNSWSVSNLQVKLCGSNLLPPNYSNQGYCEF